MSFKPKCGFRPVSFQKIRKTNGIILKLTQPSSKTKTEHEGNLKPSNPSSIFQGGFFSFQVVLVGFPPLVFVASTIFSLPGGPESQLPVTISIGIHFILLHAPWHVTVVERQFSFG